MDKTCSIHILLKTLKTDPNITRCAFSCHDLDKLIEIDRSGAICVNLNEAWIISLSSRYFRLLIGLHITVSTHLMISPSSSSVMMVKLMMVMMMLMMVMIKPTSKMMSSSSSSVKSSSTSFKMVLNLSTGMNPSPSMSNNLGEKLSYSWSSFELNA